MEEKMKMQTYQTTNAKIKKKIDIETKVLDADRSVLVKTDKKRNIHFYVSMQKKNNIKSLRVSTL